MNVFLGDKTATKSNLVLLEDFTNFIWEAKLRPRLKATMTTTNSEKHLLSVTRISKKDLSINNNDACKTSF